MRASMRRRQRMLEEQRMAEREQAVERGERGELGQAVDPFGALFGGLFGPLFGGIETRSYRVEPASGRWVEMADDLPGEQASADERPSAVRICQPTVPVAQAELEVPMRNVNRTEPVPDALPGLLKLPLKWNVQSAEVLSSGP